MYNTVISKNKATSLATSSGAAGSTSLQSWTPSRRTSWIANYCKKAGTIRIWQTARGLFSVSIFNTSSMNVLAAFWRTRNSIASSAFRFIVIDPKTVQKKTMTLNQTKWIVQARHGSLSKGQSNWGYDLSLIGWWGRLAYSSKHLSRRFRELRKVKKKIIIIGDTWK